MVYGPAPTKTGIQAIISQKLADGTANDRVTALEMRETTSELVKAIFYAMDTRSALNVCDYGADPDNAAADNATAFNAAFADAVTGSYHRSIYIPKGRYSLGANTVTLTGAANINIICDGQLTFSGSGSGIKLVNGFRVNIVGAVLSGSGASAGTGVELTNCSGCRVLSSGINKFSRGVYANTAGTMTIPGPNRVMGCLIDQCARGIAFEDFAEYATLEGNDVYRCSDYGIYVTAGNVRTINNTVGDCRVGIAYVGFDGTTGNSDHSSISGNTVNHNHYVGIFVQNTSYSMAVTGNQVWATIGPNGQQAGFGGYDQTFGLLLMNVENLNVSSNTFAHNRCNLGADGYVTSTFTSNTFKSDPTRTQSHFREFGANQSTTGINAANSYVGNTFAGLCTGNRAARYDFLTDGRSQNYEIVANPSDAISGPVVLSSGSSDYYFTGEQTLTIQSNYAAVCRINPVVFQHPFDISYEQLTTDLSGVTIQMPAATATSTNPCAVVGASSGTTTVRLTQRGRYRFTPTGFSSYAVSFIPNAPFDLTPTLLNSWAAMSASVQQPRYTRDGYGVVTLSGLVTGGAVGSVIFVLPPGFRPAGNDYFAASATSQFGTIRVEAGGNVVLDSAPNGTSWVSLSTVRFRAVN